MKKILLVLSVGFVLSAVAEPGYVDSEFGSTVKDAYGECVHTSYFNKNTDGTAECGEAPASVNKSTSGNTQKSGN